MDIKNLEPYIAEHPFFHDLPRKYAGLISGCASNARFVAGEYLFRQGDPAERFFLIREGRVVVELESPHLGAISIQTLDDGDVVGWSWLFPPYEWKFDARVEVLTRAIAVDAQCLRAKCDEDPAFGYELMKRFSAVMHERLQATRLQLIELFTTPEA